MNKHIDALCACIPADSWWWWGVGQVKPGVLEKKTRMIGMAGKAWGDIGAHREVEERKDHTYDWLQSGLATYCLQLFFFILALYRGQFC